MSVSDVLDVALSSGWKCDTLLKGDSCYIYIYSCLSFSYSEILWSGQGTCIFIYSIKGGQLAFLLYLSAAKLLSSRGVHTCPTNLRGRQFI